MSVYEVNFDGIVGPTHNYAGLSYGSSSSEDSTSDVSRPREAVKQGLLKMKALADLGIKQAVIPPQERPDLETFKRIGYTGTDFEIIQKASRESSKIFKSFCSSSAMWTANAATVSPSFDTLDGKVHITPSNLVGKFHRSLEPKATRKILQTIFCDPNHFTIHDRLPAVEHFGDEGAANHTRLCGNYGDAGIELFVYGRKAFSSRGVKPKNYPARHTYEANKAIIRLHQLKMDRVVIAQQNPMVIDAGAFHNDIIAVGNQNVLFFHEQAFLDQERVLEEIQDKMDEVCYFIKVPGRKVSVDKAIRSYLFNSQLVTLPEGGMMLIAPQECEKVSSIKNYLDEMITEHNPIQGVKFFDLKQSMKNGGGPACLRIRVVLSEKELAAINQNVLLDDELFKKLYSWADRNYRAELSPKDLTDPELFIESRTALDELTQILNLGSIYPFQQI